MGKTIIAISDSEGAPHRGQGQSSLWNFCIIMKYIVDSDTFELLQDCYHTFQFSMPKHLTRNVVKSSLSVHFEAINHVRKKYGCDNICFCFWNSPHDLSVLNYYDLGKILTIDLLVLAKVVTKNKYDSYSISDLCKTLDVKTEVKLHTAMGDVIRIIDLLPKLNIDNTKLLKSYVKGDDLNKMMRNLSLVKPETDTQMTDEIIPEKTGVYKLKPYVNFDKKQTTNVKEKRQPDRNVSTTRKESEERDGSCDNATKLKEKSRITRSRTDKGIPAPKDNPRTRAIRRAKENNRIRKAGACATGAK